MDNKVIMQLLMPKLIGMAKNPELKKKIIDLVNAQKEKYNLPEHKDIRIILQANNTDILVKVAIWDYSAGNFTDLVGIYSFEELVAMFSDVINKK